MKNNQKQVLFGEKTARIAKIKREIREGILTKVSSWDTFYTFIDGCMDGAQNTLHPVMVFNALYTMHAFFLAMKEMPEESDIVVLVTKMVDILVDEKMVKIESAITSVRMSAVPTAEEMSSGDVVFH